MPKKGNGHLGCYQDSTLVASINQNDTFQQILTSCVI